MELVWFEFFWSGDMKLIYRWIEWKGKMV